MSAPTVTKQYTLPQVGSYRNLVLGDAAIPEVKANEVLVKVHAVSLQYRDLVIANGHYPAPSADNLIPLSDMAGEIIALGDNVKDWKVGDRVCANFYEDASRGVALGGPVHGVLTQYRTFAAQSLVSFPKQFSYEEASTLPCAALAAYNALNGPSSIKAGDWALVLGTGGVSIWALQFAVAAGATVIVTSSSDEKLKLAGQLGAKHLINYKTTPNWDEEVQKITNNVGVDFVVEVGGSGTLAKSISSARAGTGVVSVIGHVSTDAGDGSVVFPLIMKAITLRGINNGSVAQFNNMVRLIESNPSSAKPTIDKVFPFEQAVEAYAYLESKKHVGKVVIKVAA